VTRTLSALALVLVCQFPLPLWPGVDLRAQTATPRFRSGVDVVRVTATVQDYRGRPVTGLSEADFELFDGGMPRPILEFAVAPAPITLAILVDGSGSMRISPKPEVTREAIHHLLSWIDAGVDEAALYAFDTRVIVLEPFTSVPSRISERLPDLSAFGQTSLYDAIAETSQLLARRQRARGAVVVITDGVDTSSRLGDAAVSRLVSAIDVPVYVLAERSLEPADEGRPNGRPAAGPASPLEELSTATGGRLFVVSGPASASLAGRTVVSELRHQYLIGFEPNARSGWHALLIRTRQPSLTVRTRSGYYAGPPAGRP
jgi:Ca-activated chloride channel homolog